MTENKRFTIIDGVKKGTHSGIWDNQKQHNKGIGDELWIGEVVAMLNEGVAIVGELNALHEENEQLKKENMEYYHLINCGNCKYHNYDWFDDGDEFEVCDKGHTERLMYNKFCKEWEEMK